MADSPFCQACLMNGRLSHTYKVLGKQRYKCGTCKRYSDAGQYEAADFDWRTDYASFEGNVKEKMSRMKLRPSVEFNAEMERVKKVGQRSK